MTKQTPEFDLAFRERLRSLFQWRRDVRRFRGDAVPQPLLEELLALTDFAPSVGNSQPWRFVAVASEEMRAAVRREFARCNAEALASYHGERAALYARLKLEGLGMAPVQLAVFVDEATEQGAGLGQRTMPETRTLSVVAAIHTLWLAARAHGLGLGWLSILEPERLNELLDVPSDWRFVAYLCIGWPEEEHSDPELQRQGWQERQQRGRIALCR